MKKTRILIADNHEVVRRGIETILRGRPEWEICGEVSDGREAVSAVERLKPDVVIMDISLPEINGVDATLRILKHHPHTEVLILSGSESERLVPDVLAAGAHGYVVNTDAASDLLAAVEALSQHKPWFTGKIAESVLREYMESPPATKRAQSSSRLTPREREIVQLVAEGRTNKEIAQSLDITIKTVETHRANIMTKLDLHSVSDLVRYAIRNMIIKAD